MKHNAFINTINLYTLSNPEKAIKNIPYSNSYDLTKTDFSDVKAEEICLESNTKLLKTTNTFKSLFSLDLHFGQFISSAPFSINYFQYMFVKFTQNIIFFSFYFNSISFRSHLFR